MPERSESASGLFALFRRKPPQPIHAWEADRKKELAESLALLRNRKKNERRERRLSQIVLLWPLGVGLLLGAVAPALQVWAESLGSWGVPLVFPFVVLAARPEIQVGPITHLLPTIMLYAQFPIEGLLARIVLRRQIRPLAVAGQVALFHFLGIVELLLLSGVERQLLGR